MDITEHDLVKLGFTKINNSMWRSGLFTLQPKTVFVGASIATRMLPHEKVCKLCRNGKVIAHVVRSY